MIKCIVWDLDDTLWHGTLAENGDEVALREDAAQAVRTAERRGVIQSVASRNHAEAALRMLAAFELANLFLYPQISPLIIKSTAIADIADHFNIGADAVAFVDDSPFERYEVQRYLPEVRVYAPDELDLLEQCICQLPEPSSNRRAWMEAREARIQAEQAFTGTRAEFLAECGMTLTVREAGPQDLARVTELAARANKINNLSASKSEIVALNADRPLYVCELADIFGLHGIVGAALFRRDGYDLHMDLFCVSCRVEGRGIAAAFLDGVLTALTQKMPELEAVYCRLENTREGMTLSLLRSLGFRVADKGVASGENAALARLTLPFTSFGVPWIKVLCQ